MDQQLSAAVIGYGMSAQVFHLPFLHTLPQYRIHSIVQRTGSEAAARYPGARICRNFEEVLADPAVDLVVITTPNTTHFPFAMAALQAGKHVVLEKPFTNTTAEAAQLVAAAEASGKVLSVYQNRRYVSDFKTIVQLMRQGVLGDVHEYICHFDRYRPEAKPNAWREEDLPGSGILYDLGSHLIDQVLCLFGLPKQITAFIKKQRSHARTDDYFELRLDFGKTVAILKSGMLVKHMGPRYQVHGTLGSFIKSGDDPQEALLKEGALPIGPAWGKEPEADAGILSSTLLAGDERISSLPGHFGDFYQNLHTAILGTGQLTERPEHGFNTIRLIELAVQSQNEGRTLPCSGLMDVPYPFFPQPTAS